MAITPGEIDFDDHDGVNQEDILNSTQALITIDSDLKTVVSISPWRNYLAMNTSGIDGSQIKKDFPEARLSYLNDDNFYKPVTEGDSYDAKVERIHSLLLRPSMGEIMCVMLALTLISTMRLCGLSTIAIASKHAYNQLGAQVDHLPVWAFAEASWSSCMCLVWPILDYWGAEARVYQHRSSGTYLRPNASNLRL